MEKILKYELEKFGTRLKYLRNCKGFSQLDLEIASGINRTEISRIERGMRNIEFYTIIKLANGLEIELIYLFEKT